MPGYNWTLHFMANPRADVLKAFFWKKEQGGMQFTCRHDVRISGSLKDLTRADHTSIMFSFEAS